MRCEEDDEDEEDEEDEEEGGGTRVSVERRSRKAPGTLHFGRGA